MKTNLKSYIAGAATGVLLAAPLGAVPALAVDGDDGYAPCDILGRVPAEGDCDFSEPEPTQPTGPQPPIVNPCGKFPTYVECETVIEQAEEVPLLEDRLAAKNARIARQQARIARQQARIARQQARIVRQQERITRLQTRVAALRERLANR